MKRKKGILLCTIISLGIIISSQLTYAETNTINSKQQNYESIINNYFDSISNHDWNTYESLQTYENMNNTVKFLNNSDNEKNNIGEFNVNSCKVDKVKLLSESDISAYTNIERYKDMYKDVNTYLVAVNYNVKKEDKYLINGDNYRLVTLGKENNSVKIIEDSDAPLEALVPKGLGFNNNDEKNSYENIKKRFKGQIVNKKGVVLETNIVDPVQYKNEQISHNLLVNKSTSVNQLPLSTSQTYTYPSTIRIYRTATGAIDVINFTTYIQNVLPKEWVQLQAGGTTESLKAGALAVKMFSWYHVIHPKYTKYDLTDSPAADQIYVPGCASADDNTAISNVGLSGICGSDGNIFEAQYWAGVSGQVGTRYSGKMEQWGTVAFDKANMGNAIAMSYYYWSYSKSPGLCNTFGY